MGARIVRRALGLLERFGDDGAEATSDAAHARARLLITCAFSEFEMHGLARGERALEEALTAAAACDGLDVVSLVHDLRGLMLIRSGDLEGSLPEFDASIDLIDHLDPADQPSVYLNRGTVHLFRGDIGAAREDLERSIVLATAQDLTRLEFKARHNLGYAEFLSGNLPHALDILARAEALEVDDSGVALLDRARVLMEAGLLAEADEALAEASRLMTLGRANQDRAEARLARAELALLQGNWTQAKTHSSQARRDFRRRQSVGWQARADVTRWQAFLDSKGGAARVTREIQTSIAVSPTSTARDHEVSLIAAEAHLALGQVDRAVGLLEGLPATSRKDPLSAQLHQNLVRAGVSRAAGDLTTARRELRTGLNALAEQQARHPSLDLRTAMAVHGGRLAELDLRIALESSTPATVFDSLERWRAMSHRRTAVTPPSDPELADLLSQLRIVSEDIRTAPPGTSVEHQRRRQQSLERTIREREWRLQGDGRSERSVRLRDLRGALAERSADVISYYHLDRQLCAVTVVRGRCQVHTLAPWHDVSTLLKRIRADLDALSGRLLPSALRAAITRSLKRDLERLDHVLLPDVVADSGSLVVVPALTLATAPWGLFPRRAHRATTVSVSTTGWLRGLQSEPLANPSVLVMAGPALPLSGREVRDVAAIWPGAKAIESTQGSATALAEALTSNDLVHIAAHGTHNLDNPLFSSIRLAGGPLYAYDIPQDRSIAGHIVLSACDLGLTTPRPGGEVLGLTAAFLGMGAGCVVSSIARVDDTTAHATMRRYHELLASGVDSAAALAASDDGDLSHPAPFVTFGSPWAAQPPRA